MKELANSIEYFLGNINSKVFLDIGYNDVTLIDIFAKKGALTYGIEPIDAYKDAILKK